MKKLLVIISCFVLFVQVNAQDSYSSTKTGAEIDTAVAGVFPKGLKAPDGDPDSVIYIDNSGNIQINNPITLGSNVITKTNYALSLGRVISDNINSRGYLNEEKFIPTIRDFAYAAFDAASYSSGTLDIDHIIGFQSRVGHQSSDTIKYMYGFGSWLAPNGGNVNNSYGLYIADPIGSGTVTANYGVYIETPIKGSVTNYALYVAGGLSRFYGTTYFQNVEVSATANLHDTYIASGSIITHYKSYTRDSYYIRNKANTAWLNFMIRNDSGAETVYDYSNIGSIRADTLIIDGLINFAIDTSTTDAYDIMLDGISVLTTGLEITFKAITANTDGATLTVNALTAKALTKASAGAVNTALATGDILAGQIVKCVYDGTQFQIISRLAQ